MEKTKKFTKLFIVFFIILFLIFAYNGILFLITGKNRVEISMLNDYSTGSDIIGDIEVYSTESNLATLKSTVKVSLLNSKGKKVKGTKEQKYKCEDGGNIHLEYEIPSDLDAGYYTLIFKVNSKKGYDKIEKVIYINKSQVHNLIISLDKGIYKPGDEVSFRGLVLTKENDKPVQNELNVSIYDGNGNKVYNEDCKTSEYGITSGKFKLADEVNSGTYKLVYSIGNEQFSKEFSVNPYVTPKFGVEVTKNSDVFKINEEATLTVNAKYFFGEPVKNAKVKLEFNGVSAEATTDSEGKYEYKYTPTKEGAYQVKVAVTDESNYMAESTTNFYCANNEFDIELLPEYGDIIKGVNNDIYVYAKRYDGTPVKTYTTISWDGKTRQVITDEKGLGMFTLSASDIPSSNYNGIFSIDAENMDKVSIQKECSIKVTSNTGTLIKTDKIKYNQGEDIKVSLKTDRSKNTIYILKNSNVIQSLTTDDREFTLNLDDKNGLISIVSLSNDGKTLENKKTIFINPKNELNVDIQTDKDEYKPGEKLKLDVELKDQNGNLVDGAILVSIIDEAIQNLAQNDLSIDNLMLSLKDIDLSDDMDLASLYATILESKDETILTGLLLKQNIEYPNIEKRSSTTDNYRYLNNAIKIFGLGCVLVVIFLIKKSKNVRIALFEIFTFVIWTIMNFYLWDFIIRILNISLYNFSGIWLYAFLGITIYLYVKFITKNKKIFITNLAFFEFVPMAFLIGGMISNSSGTIKPIIIGLIISIIILVILAKYYKKNKLDKKNYFIKCMLTLLPIPIAILSYIINYIYDYYNYMYFTMFLFDINDAILFEFVLFWIMFVFEMIKTNLKGKGKEKLTIDLNKKIEIDLKVIIGCVFGFVIVLFMGGILNNFSSNVRTSDGMSSTLSEQARDNYIDTAEESPRTSSSGTMDWSNIATTDFDTSDIRGVDTSGASSSSISLGDLLPSFESKSQDTSTNTSAKGKDIENHKEEKEKITEEKNVRNIFLESLCFIPELDTKDGKASTEIDISDNITTWEIQTVANTKNGDISYGNKEIKVFKEFFVDFSLPTNSVVGDKVSIPVTVYNYTEAPCTISLNVEKEEWFNLGEYNTEVSVDSKATSMVYVPIEIIASGKNKFRVESSSEDKKDIMELTMNVNPNGVKVDKIVESGSFEDKINLDVIYKQDSIENTNKLKVKIYPSKMTTVIENLDNIFKMPTGCFEQTSSGLYPDILALRYMEENKIDNPQLKAKALQYINSGYQRLLTFEVNGKSGGFSLYGHAPVEPVLTAYGLMELKDLSSVYTVDENVLNRMKEYLFKIQKSNGEFKLDGNSSYSTSHVTGNSNNVTLNAYITWALSEAYPDDSRLKSSVEYLEKNYSGVNDTYTLALIANVFANTNNKNTKNVLNILEKNIKQDNNKNSYLESNISDYYGTRGGYLNTQATALTSLAFSKKGEKSDLNKKLIGYLMCHKDKYGTWGTTQATILSLKAINEYSSKNKIYEQEIKVKLNEEEKTLKVTNNTLDLYEVTFDNVGKEAKLLIDSEKGELDYEVIQECYLTYEEFSKTKNELSVESSIDTECSVNDTITQNIRISNSTSSPITNGMVEISIPQGFSVKEESLGELEATSKIEKYEYNYGKIYLYLRDFDVSSFIDLNVEYKANYPETITGGLIRVYDYYNPNVEGYSMPIVIDVK